MTHNKKKVAVFFGGRSPEHDVSVYTGLEVLQAIDTSLYEAFPVYIATHGQWYIGDALRNKNNYMFSRDTVKQLTPVQLDISAKGKGRLLPETSGLFSKAKPVEFDIALPAFHGLNGEDAGFQGLMEFANVAYAGMRAKGCAVFMDKDTTKKALEGSNVPQLPHAVAIRPENSLMIDEKDVKALVDIVGLPCIVKPAHLGSSIGVGKATTLDEARALLASLFQYDDKAIIEPFVANLVEYNVALRVAPNGSIETSAIERPKTSKDLLDFKEKYMSGGNKKLGGQKSVAGMISMTRDINPDLGKDKEKQLRDWAVTVFERLDPAGAPRIDFIGNSKTGELWFNELNPIPGSYGYFLWEAAKKPVLFTEMLNDLLTEAQRFHKRKQIPHDPVQKDAQLLKRHLSE